MEQNEKCYLGEQQEWGWEEKAARNIQYIILLGIILSKRCGGILNKKERHS